MSRLIRELDAWFHAPVPAERLASLRIWIGGYALIYLVARANDFLAPLGYSEGAFAPVGVVQILAAPLSQAALYVFYVATVACGIPFLLGLWYRAVAPCFALLLLWTLSYRHSWGMIFHTDNLLALHVCLLACAPAADVYRLHGGRGRPRAGWSYFPPQQPSGWVVRALCLATVASYVVAGVAKLETQGLHWIAGEPLREQIAYDALRKIELGSVHSPLGPWMLPHGWLFPPLSAFALGAELLAPLALLGGPWAATWCLSAWLFHLGVLATMAIVFPYPLAGCAFVSFFPIERAWLRIARRIARPS
jgi:hypothetical protein